MLALSERRCHEAARIARSTRMPDRLLEIYEALGNDPRSTAHRQPEPDQ